MTPNEVIEGGDESAIEHDRFSIEHKVDDLIATATEVKRKLRLRNITFAIVGGVFAAMLAFSVIVSVVLIRQNSDLKEITASINNATGVEARARSAETLGRAISQIGHTGVCAAFYAVDEFHPECADVTARMDEIRRP